MAEEDKPASSFMDLALELKLEIFEALPNLWTAISLRLTCRAIDAVYLEHEKSIKAALRDRLVAPIAAHYAFLTTLHLPASAVTHPPPGGWPNITPEICKGLGKTDFAVDVMRYLPYVRHAPHDNLHNIDYKCNVLDYSACAPADFDGGRLKFGEIVHEADLDGAQMPRHWFVLAEGHESGGVNLMLDALTGYVYEEIIRMSSGDVLPAAEYFAKKQRSFRACEQVFVPGQDPLGGSYGQEEKEPYDAEAMEAEGEPSAPGEFFGWAPGDGDVRWVRHLYRKYGWPGEGWRKEEGLEAVKAFVKNREEEEEEA
ncbi:hypothetical protein K438DRAFT_1808770 [Mycena galopus ATCC 62051]|nr:hypothetical protein K438DRAFT_1808770 [Mycena galopus ATCC 62051]